MKLCGAKSIEIKVPLVIRLEGTNVQLAKKLLRDSCLHVITANSLQDAAAQISRITQKNYK